MAYTGSSRKLTTTTTYYEYRFSNYLRNFPDNLFSFCWDLKVAMNRQGSVFIIFFGVGTFVSLEFK